MKPANRPRPLSALMPAVTKPALGKKGMALGKLLEHWPAIAGPETAQRATPEKLKFYKDKKGNSQATLYLAVSSAAATELEYEKPVLLEKIRMLTGETRIRDIRFVHNNTKPAKSPTPKAETKPLSPAAISEIAETTARITDPALRAVLQSFGESLTADLK